MELVRKFIDENKPFLLSCISEFKNGRQGEKGFDQLTRLENEWREIPLEEKQIPYQDGEKEFWFAYHTLHTILNPEPPTNPKGEKLDDRHPAWDIIREHLDVAEETLKRNTKLPEDIDAKRILP